MNQAHHESQAPVTPRGTGAGGWWRARLNEAWSSRWAYLFVSPFFILFAIFLVYPIFFSLYLSFHEWAGVGELRPVGFANYVRLWTDGIFWNSMLNALILFFVYVPVMTFSAVVLAAMLHGRFLRLQGIWRGLIFLPHLTSMVAAGFTFRLILDTHSGFANQAIGWLGISPIPWLDNVWWARISLGLLMIWAWLGYNTVIMLSGLQTIPNEVNEAARVDGASRLQVFFRITIPLLKPVIVFALTLSVIGTFQMFTEPYILTRGGPIRATETPVMQIFSNTFTSLRFGYAAAMSYVYFITIIVLAIIQFRFVNRGYS